MNTKSRRELQDVARVLNIYAGGEREEIEERLLDEFLTEMETRSKRELQDVARVLGVYAGGTREELEARMWEELSPHVDSDDDDSDDDDGVAAYQSFCAEVMTWNKTDMKEFLNTFGLPVSGNKDVLCARIAANYPYPILDDDTEEEQYSEEASESDDDDDGILNLGARLQGMGLDSSRKALIVACSYR
jgi:hypothetical protein